MKGGGEKGRWRGGTVRKQAKTPPIWMQRTDFARIVSTSRPSSVCFPFPLFVLPTPTEEGHHV